MTTFRRPVHVPDGHYAVADPAGNETYWTVVAGRWADYPPGTRHRPLPPATKERLSRADHRRRMADWYEAVYAGWCAAVAEAIEADPDAARQRFAERWGHLPVPVELPLPPVRQPPRRRSGQVRSPAAGRPARARRKREDAVVVLRLAGLSYRAIARLLGCSPMTAWRLAAHTRREGPTTTTVPDMATSELVLGAACDTESPAPGSP